METDKRNRQVFSTEVKNEIKDHHHEQQNFERGKTI